MAAKYTNRIIMYLPDDHYKKVMDYISSLPYPVPVSSYARELLLKKIEEETTKANNNNNNSGS